MHLVDPCFTFQFRNMISLHFKKSTQTCLCSLDSFILHNGRKNICIFNEIELLLEGSFFKTGVIWCARFFVSEYKESKPIKMVISYSSALCKMLKIQNLSYTFLLTCIAADFLSQSHKKCNFPMQLKENVFIYLHLRWNDVSWSFLGHNLLIQVIFLSDIGQLFVRNRSFLGHNLVTLVTFGHNLVIIW